MVATTQQKLDYLISQKVAEHQNIKWGSGVRNVVIIEGKKHQYKEGNINKSLEKNISSLYIELMKSSKEKTKKMILRHIIYLLKQI